MKSVLRFLFQSVCLFLVAAGSLAALLASCAISAMLIAWYQEGALQTTDHQILARAAQWLLGSCVLVGVAWQLRRRTIANNAHDDTFKLVQSESGRPEKLVQEVFEILFFVFLAIGLWGLIPGSAVIKVPTVAGWLTVGFLGMHARIFLHELGHLVAARLLGLDLRKIQVGVGPLLWSHTLASGVFCEWRFSPEGGFVLASHRSTESFKARQSLFVTAGPLADILILWCSHRIITRAFGGLGAAFTHSSGGLIVFALFWWTAMSAVTGLVPLKVWMGHRRVWSDGYWLLRLWTASKEGMKELASNPEWRAALELLRASRPDGKVIVVEPEGPGSRPGSSLTFQQQQAQLASRLLPTVKTEGVVHE